MLCSGSLKSLNLLTKITSKSLGGLKQHEQGLATRKEVIRRVPELCLTIECKGNTRPVFFPELKCDCEPNLPICPNTIFCAAGVHEVLFKHNENCTYDLDGKSKRVFQSLKVPEDPTLSMTLPRKNVPATSAVRIFSASSL